MLRTPSLRAVFSLPAAFALAVALLASSASATSEDQRQALNARLQKFARQENKLTTPGDGSTAPSTQAKIDAVNTVTAPADDLVYAVYELAQQAGTDPAKIADIAAGALLTTSATAKVRADKDKVVGRILEAVILGTIGNGQNGTLPANSDVILNSVLTALGNVNSGQPASKQLTVAGKQLLIAKALRTAVGQGTSTATTLATNIGVIADGFVPPSTTPVKTDAARTAFHVAVLKLLAFKPLTNDPAVKSTAGTYFPIRDGVQRTVIGEPAFSEGVPPSIFTTREYINRVLDGYTSTPKATAALNIATGVAATVPSAAGSVIAGYVQDSLVSQGDAAIISYLQTGIITNTKLAAAVSDIVADSFRLLTAAPTANSVATFATGVTAATKGKIASGAIRANPSDATNIVNAVLGLNDGAGKAVLQTGIAAFAGAAAVGNSSAADEITVAAINKILFVPAAGATPSAAAQAAAAKADTTKIQAVAIAVGKSVALVNPNAVNDVAESLFGVTRNGANPYSVAGATGEPARIQLAADLAKGLATNYSAAGAAVAGVVHQAFLKNQPTTADAALNQAVLISGAAIKASAKAATMIALKVSASAPVQAIYSFGGTTSAFATKLANNPSVASTSAGSIAAGVSLSDTANSGAITAAVVDSSDKLRAAALTIANTVAINVDVEAIGRIAQSVGALLQPAKLTSGATNTSKLPKLSTGIGTLATSLAKAINTKPLVVWSNRVDELSELAAELTKQYLAKAGIANSGVPSGASGTTADFNLLAKGIATIGTNIFKAVSVKLLANTGNFAVDVKDIANDVAGAIAQTIANSNSLAIGAKEALLETPSTTTGSLIKLLVTAATASKSGSLVTEAFAAVAGTQTVPGGAYGNVGGTKVRENGSTGRFETGVNYEVGVMTDPETQIKNI